ncbi:MAG: bifunctional ADP-heptose synthase [Bacteroidota bacterium]
MTAQDIDQLFASFAGTRVLVIGDIMIDAYLWGKVDRISPEAPVPVISITKKEYRLGGAANVALNLKALGAEPIICASYGTDESAKVLAGLMNEHQLSCEGLIATADKPTTVKTRVISAGQHMLRIDEELDTDLDAAAEQEVLRRIDKILDSGSIDVLIFEDYNKGLLTETLIGAIIERAREKGIPTAVDPKKKNFLSYRNVDLFKPNLKELREGLKVEIDRANVDQVRAAVEKLSGELDQRIAFITLSEYGVFLKSNEFDGIIPAHKREIADVSGAGDTVISVAALCLAKKVPHHMLAALSNLAGGLVCEEVGVVPITKEKLHREALKLV